jgi:hypothetical protein
VKINSMTYAPFILALAVSSAGCQPWSGQPMAPVAPASPALPMPGPTTPYPVTGAPAPVFLPGPPYLETAPVIVTPAPDGMPVFPPPVAPPPAVVPMSPLTNAAPGGPVSPQFGLPVGPEMAAGIANPIAVPVADEQFAWDQIADVVSDYFTIAREQQARRSGEAVMEGFIEAAPQTGATWLEPHRRDSVGSFNRWESTLQTIRRRALVRVIPDAAGYLVEVIVEKELEDLPKPEHATAGAATFRNDGSLPSRRLEQVSHTRSSPRWIPLGRDPLLEQRMLAEIHARLAAVSAGGAPIFTP